MEITYIIRSSLYFNESTIRTRMPHSAIAEADFSKMPCIEDLVVSLRSHVPQQYS